jgi:hypothetical protein
MYSFRITWHSSGPEVWQLYHIGTRPVRRDIPSLVVTSQSCMPASWAGEVKPSQSRGVRTTRRLDKWTRRSSFAVCGRNCPLPGSAEWVVLRSFRWGDDEQSRNVTPRGMEWSLTNGIECGQCIGSNFQNSMITRVIAIWFTLFFFVWHKGCRGFIFVKTALHSEATVLGLKENDHLSWFLGFCCQLWICIEVPQWLRYYAASQKVAVSSPDEVDFLLIALILPAALWPWGRLSL